MQKRALVVWLLATLSTTVASAAVFDYGYTYDTGTRVTGSFSGDLNGSLIANVTDITVLVNGSTLADVTYRPYGLPYGEDGLFGGPYYISPIRSRNSFAFTNATSAVEGDFTSLFLFDGNLSTGNFPSHSEVGIRPDFSTPFALSGADRPVNDRFFYH